MKIEIPNRVVWSVVALILVTCSSYLVVERYIIPGIQLTLSLPMTKRVGVEDIQHIWVLLTLYVITGALICGVVNLFEKIGFTNEGLPAKLWVGLAKGLLGGLFLGAILGCTLFAFIFWLCFSLTMGLIMALADALTQHLYGS